jgi:acyl-CoA thioesterase-2
MAAGATVARDRAPHSLHAYFVRGGDPAQPIRYEVDVVRDGRSFSHRQVVATQDGREVFRQLASFHVAVPGPEHDDPVEVGDVDPSTLVVYEDWAETGTDNPDHDVYTEATPCELRYEAPPPPGPGRRVRGPQRLWARVTGRVDDDRPLLHAALLAWLSDKSIADFSTLAHGRRWTDLGTDSVSLDNAMWFLRPFRADEWLLYAQEAPSSAGGRAFTRGEFVTMAGQRVAAVTQEVLLTLPG